MATANAASSKHTVVIVGAGAGGVSVAAGLRRALPGLDIALVEPSAEHYYQPAWTLVGGGQYDIARTRRSTESVLPSGVQWVRGRVARFFPDDNEIELEGGARLAYEILVVAAGIQLNWDAIEGLAETLGKHGVTSNYRFELAPYTWDCVRTLKQGGTAIFTQPGTPIKCAGAPQKALYLAADHLHKQGTAADLRFYNAGASIFGVPFYAAALEKVMASYGAEAGYGKNLVAVNGPDRIAIFESTVDGQKLREEIHFDLLHVVPPQSAPDFIRNSSLADAGGWLEVDKHTLRHVRHANIYGLGDCTSTPNSKTAAAVKSQAPIVVRNVYATLRGHTAENRYDGYAACPLTTSVGKVLLAEFSYGGVVSPSLPLDPRVPRRLYWWAKKSFLPFFYWNILLKGRFFASTHKARTFSSQVPALEA